MVDHIKSNISVKNNLVKLCIQNLHDHVQTITSLEKNITDIIYYSEKIAERLKNGGKIYWCGNGGSASDCQHLSAEFVCRFKKDRRALSSISLTTDTSALTAIANDYDFESIFARQIEANMNCNDVLIAISTSGKSKNIIKALETSRNMNILSIALTGKDGGEMKNSTENIIYVDSFDTARIQEVHIFIGHLICQIIEEILL